MVNGEHDFLQPILGCHQMVLLFNLGIMDNLVNINFLYNNRFKALSFLILKGFKDSLLSHNLFSLSLLNLSLFNLNLLSHNILKTSNSFHNRRLLNLEPILLGLTMCRI